MDDYTQSAKRKEETSAPQQMGPLALTTDNGVALIEAECTV
jgi:hypothetical protein